MTKRLALRKETLGDLSPAELEKIVAGDASLGVCASVLCPFTIGGSCGIVCITVGLQCFTDDC